MNRWKTLQHIVASNDCQCLHIIILMVRHCFVVHSQGTRKMTDIRAKAEEWSTSTQEVELSSAMDMELNDAALEAQMAADNESPAGSKFVGGVRRPTI